MPSEMGFHQSRIADLRLSSPTNGFLIKATEQVSQGHAIGALKSLFTALDPSPLLKGEKDNIITFTHDPLSWGFRITGSMLGKYSTVHLHAVDTRTKELKLEDKEDLIRIAELVVGRLNELSRDKQAPFRRPALCDDVLLRELRGVNTLQHQSFLEAERTMERGCLGDACVELFTPFGLQPTLDSNEVSFGSRYLWDGMQQLCWIKRADKYLDIEQSSEEEKQKRKLASKTSYLHQQLNTAYQSPQLVYAPAYSSAVYVTPHPRAPASSNPSV